MRTALAVFAAALLIGAAPAAAEDYYACHGRVFSERMLVSYYEDDLREFGREEADAFWRIWAADFCAAHVEGGAV